MIGFDIGGTKCAVTVGQERDGGLHIEDKVILPTDLARTPYEMIDRMCAAAERMTRDFSRIGISCGGPLDSRSGVILSPPNLPGWDRVAIADYLRARYGGKVALQNDANACALAEWRYGAGRGVEDMIFLTFGTGMGAGLILNGRLYTGASDMAGEIGHVRIGAYGPVGYGKCGSFEGFCSGGGIAQLGVMRATERLQQGLSVSYCKSRAELPLITARRIAELAEQGDADARAVYDLCAEKLGQGLSILIDLLNPELIVIGSIFSRSEGLLRENAMRVIEAETLPHARNACRILPAALGEQLGDYAALSVAAGIDCIERKG